MGFRECAVRAIAAASLIACTIQAGPAVAQAQQAPTWQSYLKRATIERVQISPDGKRLAVAERADNATFITVRNAETMAIETQFDPGDGGEIHALRWLDDDRLLVAANAVVKKYNVAFNEPVMAIVARDGKSRYMLPANFLATIDGDAEHLLVTKCTHWGEGGCFDAVHKVEIGHLSRLGESLVTAPDRDSVLFSDRRGNVRFAASVDDKANTKLQALAAQDKPWTVVNDSEKSGVNVWPIGVDASGDFAFVEAERKTGPSVVERYDFATGTRTELYRHANSDTVSFIAAFDGETPIGAYYEPTAPRAVLWNPKHPDAGAIRQILAAFPGRMADITSATRDRNKAIVLTHGDRDPGTWYLFDRAANRATLIARARNWLPETSLPKNREVVFTARDGVPLRGVLTLPPTGQDRGLPMIVIPHGGPHGVYDTSMFDAEAGLLASQGYAVLRVNFRGSGGYGKEFEERGWMQWGRAMQDDVTDATRWAIQQGVADANRICLYGASYGGYAALMGAAREPALYRCVVGYAAPYDLAKMYKWGSIRRSDLGLDYLAKVIGKDEKELAARSPAKLAGSIKVPVFIAHGRLDGRVDVAHSRRMVKALEKAGTEVEFHEYLKAGHGLALEEDELDFYARLLAFVGKHTAPR
jgi:dipeptidyl aminopeptidase/acylaminoacyl peptidase